MTAENVPKVVISYAHEPPGRVLERALHRVLSDAGFDVVSDRDLLGAASLQRWMVGMFSTRIIVVALTADYVRAFDGQGGEHSPRQGVAFEATLMRVQNYRNHSLHDSVPVVLVATPDFDVDQLPLDLAAMVVRRFDPVTGAGAEKLLAHIRDVAFRRRREVSAMSSERSLRQIHLDLEKAEPMSARAVDTVYEFLGVPDEPDHALELAAAFPAAAKVAKAAGDVQLVRQISDKCLTALRKGDERLVDESRMEGRILICGAGWCLQREYRLATALQYTNEGMALADRLHDHYGIAHGHKNLGRIQRLNAERARRGAEAEHLLRTSVSSLERAAEQFATIGGCEHDVGSCYSLTARTCLSSHLMVPDDRVLTRAWRLVDRAEELLLPAAGKNYFDLLILKVELLALTGSPVPARRMINEVIEHLLSIPGAGRSEIHGRARMIRANLYPGSRGRADARRDLQECQQIFERIGLNHPAAAAKWAIARQNPKSVSTLVRLTDEDMVKLEHLTVDPCARLLAIADLERQHQWRAGGHAVTAKVDWSLFVRPNEFEN
ncbi:hypothetical protein [Kutzneria buriramensis]|uniref:TIR domain-containing protein n=1 Tax=Kutzneria buriramensis TaxID=1045776 RepID=A0A3E0H412_9PSEU|nr:hypothetical protein [Kutzneria buriramensis]REH37055.1 hypothetical protein BCF44_11559 [Kutzneria buriramensis]